MKYSVGRQRVPLFAACGEMWEILKNNVLLCVIVGSKAHAQAVVDQLNEV